MLLIFKANAFVFLPRKFRWGRGRGNRGRHQQFRGGHCGNGERFGEDQDIDGSKEEQSANRTEKRLLDDKTDKQNIGDVTGVKRIKLDSDGEAKVMNSSLLQRLY